MIAFEHPAVLLALLPLAPLCAWRAGSAARAAARAGLAAALLAAAAGPHRERSVEVRGRVVVARDAGGAVRPGELDGAPRGDLAGEFVRGSDGILRGAALAGPGGAVVLATPARWDAAEASEAARAAELGGVPVFLWAPPPGAPDAAVTGVWVAVAPVENEPFEILAAVEGVPAARGEAILLVDNAPAGRRTCDSPRALLRFTAALPAGIHALAVRFETPSDAERRNNVALGLVEVRGAPRVLVVEGVPGAGAAAAAALEAQGIRVVRERAGGAPPWGDFAAVVLARVDPATIAAPESLAEAVASGTGLLAVVGPMEAAAWGSHALGAMLPLTLRAPDPSPPSPDPGPDTGPPAPSDETPRILLILVLDRSGSMAGTKIQAAKEAAIASATTLSEGDRVGVVAFDSEAHWLLEPTDASARGTIADAISRLQPGGETDVYAGLAEAGKRTRGQKVPVRHVILMTDGQTPSADFRALVQDLAADGVTVSTIGIGQDFDGDLLANIAQWGKGRFYFTSRPDEIPRLFTLESRRIAAGAPAPRARPSPGLPPPPRALEFLPVLAAEADPSTDGLAGWPSLAGACGEEPRPHARLLLKAGARPLLAVRRAALGRVAAFAAPLDGPEAARWTSWERFPSFSAQLVRTLMRPEAAGPALEVAADGDRRHLFVRTAGERPRVSLDGAPLELDALAANAWGTTLEARAFPDLRRVDAAVGTGHSTAAAAWDWPAALRPRPRAVLPFPSWSEAAVAARPAAPRTERESLRAWPLLAAVLFLLLETWLRRRRP